MKPLFGTLFEPPGGNQFIVSHAYDYKGAFKMIQYDRKVFPPGMVRLVFLQAVSEHKRINWRVQNEKELDSLIANSSV